VAAGWSLLATASPPLLGGRAAFPGRPTLGGRQRRGAMGGQLQSGLASVRPPRDHLAGIAPGNLGARHSERALLFLLHLAEADEHFRPRAGHALADLITRDLASNAIVIYASNAVSRPCLALRAGQHDHPQPAHLRSLRHLQQGKIHRRLLVPLVDYGKRGRPDCHPHPAVAQACQLQLQPGSNRPVGLSPR